MTQPRTTSQTLAEGNSLLSSDGTLTTLFDSECQYQSLPPTPFAPLSPHSTRNSLYARGMASERVFGDATLLAEILSFAAAHDVEALGRAACVSHE